MVINDEVGEMALLRKEERFLLSWSPSHHETTMLVKKWVGACDGVAFWNKGGYGFVPLLLVAKRLKVVYCRCEKKA